MSYSIKPSSGGIISSGKYTSCYCMDRHYFTRPANQPLTSVRLRLYFTRAELTALGITDPGNLSASSLKVFRYEGPAEDGMYNPYNTGSLRGMAPSLITTGTEQEMHYFEFSINGFSEFWIGTNNNMLPVELFDFRAVKLPASVRLSWCTVTEINSHLFIIEKSTDNIHFTTIARINAAGNSITRLHYSIEDKSPVAGSNYYRLKQVNRNGISGYSSIVHVR